MKDLDEVVAEEDEIVEQYDYYSDSDLEDTEDLGDLNENATTDDRPRDTIWGFLASLVFSHPQFDSGGDHIPAPREERIREGRVIRVQDVAFVT